ncbi:MAG TPA: hypothetical protein ENN27_01295 [Candidatus Atribacteria bacterium]|nr:hypothetical protein [Candidatus Atribacteria bacterium]
METNTLEKNKVHVGRDAKGRFVKGYVANPTGRNHFTFIEELTKALDDESKRQGYKNFAQVVAKRALQYEVVLVAVLKKICPDLVKDTGFAHKNITVIFNNGEPNNTNTLHSALGAREIPSEPGKI